MWKRLAEQDESSSRKQGNRDEEIQKFLDILSSKRHQEIMEVLVSQNNKVDYIYKHFMSCLMDESSNVKLELKCPFCLELKLKENKHSIHECPYVQRIKKKWKLEKEAVLMPPSAKK